MRRRAGALVLVVGTLAALGCGIGTSDRVEQADSELLELVNEPTTTTTTLPPADAGVETTSTAPDVGSDSTVVEMETIQLYFIEGSALRAIEGEVPADARLRQRLRLLEEVPPRDAEAGVRTAVAPGLISGTEAWGTDGVNVDLDGELFAEIDDTDQRLMFGQIVLTVTEEPQISQVTFSVDDEPIQVFLRGGSLSEAGEPVTRSDYEGLLADGAVAASNRATTDSIRSSVSLDAGP